MAERGRGPIESPEERDSLTETPEFKSAVKDAVDALLPDLMAQVHAAYQAAGAKTEPKDVAVFANALALGMAKIGAQNSGQVYIDPAVIEERDKATKELQALLIDIRAQIAGAVGEAAREAITPRYRLIGKVQLPIPGLGHVLIDPLYRDRSKVQHHTEIDCPIIPNLMMQPVNEPARRVMDLFRKAVGEELPHGEEDLGAIALSPTGVVVRGAAAEMILRNSRQQAGMAPQQADPNAVTIRRGDDPVKRKVQVLGTLTQPIEVQ